MRTKSSRSRAQNKRASRGVNPPARRSSGARSTRDRDPLDYDGGGAAARDRSRAVRRSVARTGIASPGVTPFKGSSTRLKPSNRRTATTALARTRSSRASEVPEKLSTRKHAPASSQRKGGPGKRRPFPKKSTSR
jgi:hypothetical protein